MVVGGNVDPLILQSKAFSILAPVRRPQNCSLPVNERHMGVAVW